MIRTRQEIWDEVSEISKEQWEFLEDRMGKVNKDNLEKVFTYQPPTKEMVEKMICVSDHCIALGNIILGLVPECADKSDALRKLRELRMIVNSAIVLDGEI